MSGGNRPPIVVMGVSGSGKSTVAAVIAERLNGVFVDADDLHSAQARAKMASGTPLTDEDRAPWLDRVAARMSELSAADVRPVVACSALRKGYRDRLRAGTVPDVVFIHLVGDEDTLYGRLQAREGHFMSPALLRSQLDTLEALIDGENGIGIPIHGSIDSIVDAALGAVVR